MTPRRAKRGKCRGKHRQAQGEASAPCGRDRLKISKSDRWQEGHGMFVSSPEVEALSVTPSVWVFVGQEFGFVVGPL